MTVWLVWFRLAYVGDDLRGIYASEGSALEAMARLQERGGGSYDIEEREVAP